MMLERLLRKAWFPLSLRVLTLAVFIGLLVSLYTGSLRLPGIAIDSAVSMFLIWTLWWPLLYLSLPLAGRAWCGFLCPLSLANETGNDLRTGKAVNLARWGFLAYVLFFVVVFLEQVSGLFLSPVVTLAFLAGSFGLAFLMGLAWRRLSFCKLVCPIGTLLGVFARLSPVGVRTDSGLCRACKTFECLRGTEKAAPCPVYINVPMIRSNKECLVCAYCIKSCPYGSARIVPLAPGREISERRGFTLAESLFIIALLGLTAVLTSNGTSLLRKALSLSGIGLAGASLRGADFILGLGLFLLAYGCVAAVSGWRGSSTLRERLATFGYAYLPLTFFIMSFLIVFGFLGPVLPLGKDAIAIMKYLLVAAGLVWSLRLLFRMSRSLAEAAPHSLLLLGTSALWLLALIPGPLALYTGTESVAVVLPGQSVNMDAFSMGFTPSTLIAQKGMPVVINLTNVDINHAFDIDEFNVHLVIAGGRTGRVMFIPNRTGTFEIYCSVPGHREAGMTATLIVED